MSTSTAANAASGPNKQEIESVFSRLRAQPANKSCFDCSAKAPTWSSVTYGILICIDCSAVHRNLGVHLTFVRSTNLDTNWTWLQLRQMQLGGNANAAQFFRQHNCVTSDAQQKYTSRAAQLYRDKLANMAAQAMKVHGTKLHLDGGSEKTERNENENKEEDFFAEHSIDNNQDALFCVNNNGESDTPSNVELTPKATTPAAVQSGNGAPSVDLLNSSVPTATLTPSIGVRKIQPKKTGMGARKGGGLGATKVKTNFAEIEQRANLANQPRDSAVPEKPMTVEEELESVASMRLAYQDLSLQKTKEEAKLKTIDPMKAKQMERLGMGFNLRGSDVSHSAVSDMQTIQQTGSSKGGTQQLTKASDFENESFFNDYTPTMYGGFSSTSKADKHELEQMGFETIEPIGSHHSNITSMFASGAGDAESKSRVASSKATPATTVGYDSYSRKSSTAGSQSNNKKNGNSFDGDAAQKKFGGAKGFGSDQYFGNDQSDLPSANLTRFQGSNSISSSDYFNDGSSGSAQTNRGSRGYTTGVNFQTPDLDDVKESVRQGVQKVAGRLGMLANDMMSTLQDKYGY